MSWAVFVHLVASQLLHEFLVKRTVRHKFEGADRVCHALEVVALAVCEVVHRIHLPLVAGAPVWAQYNAIDDRVAEVHVVARHIYFCAKHMAAFWKFASIHASEEVEVFLHRAVAERTFLARSGRSALLSRNLLAGLVVDVCLALLNQADSEIVELLEIVACVVQTVAPVVTQPLNVAHNGLLIFSVFFSRVGVVETQVAGAAKHFSHPEVHAEGLSVANVQVSIWFGWETSAKSSTILASCQVVGNNLLNKVQALFLFLFVELNVVFSHIL